MQLLHVNQLLKLWQPGIIGCSEGKSNGVCALWGLDDHGSEAITEANERLGLINDGSL